MFLKEFARANGTCYGNKYDIGTAKKRLDQVRDKIRFKHYSLSTEDTYVYWIKQFILLTPSVIRRRCERPKSNGS
ncbi:MULTISPECIES: phage integrase N-terminal SAM-like domain-containing protein [Methylomonas]|uniref:phage integrase N-terminal SAM-like domain-containing protein n=1 Tax=Methylomonas TaxID=416 RepID=UPI000B082B12